MFLKISSQILEEAPAAQPSPLPLFLLFQTLQAELAPLASQRQGEGGAREGQGRPAGAVRALGAGWLQGNHRQMPDVFVFPTLEL